MPKFTDLTGQRFGRWVVIARAHDWRPGHPQWLCRCECGNEKVVRGAILRRGHSKSCGCYNRDLRRTLKTHLIHGKAHTKTWHAWVNIKQRCLNPNASGYEKYGARGITVWDRWRDSFEAFLADVGEAPSPLHSIDRIDPTRGYEPGNVRWALMKVQQNNRTNNHIIEHNGERLTVAQWSDRLGIHRHTISHRIKRGWPMEKVLSPIRHGRSGNPLNEARS